MIMVLDVSRHCEAGHGLGRRQGMPRGVTVLVGDNLLILDTEY